MSRRILGRRKRLMSELSKKQCIPCQGGVPPLKGEALTPFHHQIHEEWKLVNEHHLEREFKFPNFKQAMAFANQVGGVAEAENHHPEITVGWGHALVQIWTHKIDGLTESDFIFAAKCDQI